MQKSGNGSKLRWHPCLAENNPGSDASIATDGYVCINNRSRMARKIMLNTYRAKIQRTAVVDTISEASIECPCSR